MLVVLLVCILTWVTKVGGATAPPVPAPLVDFFSFSLKYIRRKYAKQVWVLLKSMGFEAPIITEPLNLRNGVFKDLNMLSIDTEK